MGAGTQKEQEQDIWAERTRWVELFKRASKGVVAALEGLRRIGMIQPLKPTLRAILRPVVDEVFDLKS